VFSRNALYKSTFYLLYLLTCNLDLWPFRRKTISTTLYVSKSWYSSNLVFSTVFDLHWLSRTSDVGLCRLGLGIETTQDHFCRGLGLQGWSWARWLSFAGLAQDHDQQMTNIERLYRRQDLAWPSTCKVQQPYDVVNVTAVTVWSCVSFMVIDDSDSDSDSDRCTKEMKNLLLLVVEVLVLTWSWITLSW